MTDMTPTDPASLLANAKDPTQVLPGPQAWTPPSPEELSALIPGLVVESLIGRGGMGAVFRARQVRLDRLVALKILPPAIGRDPEAAERFAREARTMAKLKHPGIISVYDHGQAGEFLWLTMELIDGANLRQVMRTGSLSPESALRLIPFLCSALQYAHDHGVVHRDLKPENILIDGQGIPWIADFGLARSASEGDSSLTQTGQILGTFRYMAPEMIAGAKTVDHRVDIYALGVVLYELLTGSLPQGRFEPPSRRVAVDVHIDEVVLRSLERDPDRRFQRADDLSRAVADADCAAGLVTPVPAPMPVAVPVAASLPMWWQSLQSAKRSRQNMELAGVCGGLGAATPLPAWMWRVAFVSSCIVWGFGLLLYVILWICMPKGTDQQRPSTVVERISAVFLLLTVLFLVVLFAMN